MGSLRARTLIEHVQATAPADATVVVRVDGQDHRVTDAVVEPRPGAQPVLALYVAPPR